MSLGVRVSAGMSGSFAGQAGGLFCGFAGQAGRLSYDSSAAFDPNLHFGTARFPWWDKRDAYPTVSQSLVSRTHACVDVSFPGILGLADSAT